MQVYSYVGKRAAAVRAPAEDEPPFGAGPSPAERARPFQDVRQRVSQAASASGPRQAVGAINGFSPARAAAARAAASRAASVRPSATRSAAAAMASSRPSPVASPLAPAPRVSALRVQELYAEPSAQEPRDEPPRRRGGGAFAVVQAMLSLGILAAVPYFVLGYLNRQMDCLDLAPFVVERAAVEEGGRAADFSVLDGVIADALEGELSRFSQSLAHADTVFDESGNLVLADGTVVSSDSVNPGVPVEWTDYRVGKGDTIDRITYRFGLSNISTLIAANSIQNVKRLFVGQKLRIPSQDGIPHVVSSGESLNSISVKYHVSVEEILDANDLATDSLAKGQELFIPGAKMDKVALRNAMGETFACPLSGKWRLTSHFGKRIDPISGVRRSHTGIDMAMPKGTPIKAAMGGRVIKATFSPIFGYYVVIDHGNGYQSLYGHMTKYVVKSGQYVNQGQKIGNLGSTGYSTGPHLHFTVYKNGRLVDPLPLIK